MKNDKSMLAALYDASAPFFKRIKLESSANNFANRREEA